MRKDVDPALISELTRVVENRQPPGKSAKRHGEEMRFLCPAHDDTNPSADWNPIKATWVCRACNNGGGAIHLAKLLKIDIGGEGYTSTGSRSNLRTPETKRALDTGESPGLTLEQYATAKCLPVADLPGWGVTQQAYMGSPALRISYRGQSGSETAVRYRLALTGPDRFRWRKRDKPTLYGLERLAEARAVGFVVIVEGESDAHTCWLHEVPALAVPGASNWNEPRDAPHLDGIDAVYVVIEPDAGGEAMLRWISTSAIRDRVRLLRLPVKDVSALHLDDSEMFKERLDHAMAAAQPWAEQAAQQAMAEALTAERDAGGLLDDPALWERIGNVISARGYVGDARPVLLAFLGMTSRFLPRPVNLAFVAPSAAGKNAAVDAAAALLPPEAVYRMSAGSARALIYDDNDFTNVAVIVEEADAIPDEGPVASAIRALAEQGAMSYHVVERDETTSKFYTRHIVKPGPTQLTTTSTRSLAHQLGTRVLEVPISDTEAQTLAVMRYHAKRAAGALDAPPDTAPFVALQRWLGLAGERRVVVPFAERLIELIPARQVRMRRDVQSLLTCVRAVAFLYQRQRSRAPNGEIVATLGDYEIARDLLAPIFDSIEVEGVTAVVRATVEVIKVGEEVTLTEVAKRLVMAKSSASYRVDRALAAGVLVNNEPNDKKPKRLARGSELPEARSTLPSVADLRGFEGSNEIPVESTPLPPMGDARPACCTCLSAPADGDGGRCVDCAVRVPVGADDVLEGEV